MAKSPILSQLKSEVATRLNLPFLYRKSSYSQEGEDLILQKLFRGLKKGFYVDVGAYHPFHFSNTQLLYEQGWCGINIEPTPGRIDLFNRVRQRDINIETAISARKESLTFHMFKDAALNTFDTQRSSVIRKSNQSRYIGNIQITTTPLSTILKDKAKHNINLLNIDVEGFETLVLKSNDWKHFRPDVILVENFHYLPSFSYLRKYEYVPFAQTYSTQYFRKKNLKIQV